MTTATLEPVAPGAAADTVPLDPDTDVVACPHCKKLFAPAIDATQPPRLQGAKCPNCRLFVPARLFVHPA